MPSLRQRYTLEYLEKIHHKNGLRPLLKTVKDKVLTIQVFLHRVRHGHSSGSGKQVRPRTAEEYVRSVAQAYLVWGALDQRLDFGGNVDF